MKIKRSSKFTNVSKLETLDTILVEYCNVVNFFIHTFWENVPENKDLLKPIVDLPNTWLSARFRKVAAREAISLIKSANEKAKACNSKALIPLHSGKSMNVSCTIAEIKLSKTSNEFDAWLKLRSIGNKLKLDLPIKFHKHINKLFKDGKRLNYYIISKNSVQFVFEIETGVKKKEGKLLGVDTGINALASTTDGKQYGLDIKAGIERTKRCVKGSKGQKRAIRALKQRIDEVAKEIVSNDTRLVVVEKLRNMNQKTKLKRRLSKNMRRSIGAWNYSYWLMRLQCVCERRRSSFRSVNPYKTSQECSACGLIDRRNRFGEDFKCVGCGFSYNADLNAAINILNRFLTGPYGASFKP